MNQQILKTPSSNDAAWPAPRSENDHIRAVRKQNQTPNQNMLPSFLNFRLKKKTMIIPAIHVFLGLYDQVQVLVSLGQTIHIKFCRHCHVLVLDAAIRVLQYYQWWVVQIPQAPICFGDWSIIETIAGCKAPWVSHNTRGWATLSARIKSTGKCCRTR